MNQPQWVQSTRNEHFLASSLISEAGTISSKPSVSSNCLVKHELILKTFFSAASHYIYFLTI